MGLLVPELPGVYSPAQLTFIFILFFLPFFYLFLKGCVGEEHVPLAKPDLSEELMP
jgi:hypothetical protein